MPLRLIFMGTPVFAVPTLRMLAGAGHDIVAAYTRAPKPAGRGQKLTGSPVANEALHLNVKNYTPASLKAAADQAGFKDLNADAAVVVAYGLILPPAILQATRLGCFNLHASLLPRWRGAAPINRAIMAGDRESGVAVMRMDEGLDTGAVGMSERVTIGDDITAGELHDVFAARGAELMVRAIAALEGGTLSFTPQPGAGVTYAEKISNAETRVDWAKPWQGVHDHIRGLSPYPGAWCEMPGAGRVKLLRTTKGGGTGAPGTVLDDRLTVACGGGAVRVVELQRAGGRSMQAEELLRGAPIRAGVVLG